jgi:hypothetical protein
VLKTLLTKLVNESIIDWDEHFSIVLFSYKTAYKVVTWYTPYQLMYGLYALMPIDFIIPVAGGDDKDNTLVKVLTSKITELEKL